MYFGGAEAAKVLVELALTRTLVNRTYLLPRGKTIGAIGLLFLSPVSPEEFYVHIPFILLKAVNLLLSNALFPDALLFFPTSDRPWYWQDFEVLHLHYLRVRTNTLIDLWQLRLKIMQADINATARKADKGDREVELKLIGLRAAMSDLKEVWASGICLGEVIKARGSPTMLGKRVAAAP